MKITETFSGSNTFHTFEDITYATLGRTDDLSVAIHSRVG